MLTAAARVGHVVTNMDLTTLGFKPDVVVGYRPDDYIAHIKLSKRDNLLEDFTEEQLRGWVDDLPEETIWLKPHEYLSKVFNELKL